jgi:ribosomal protein S12
MPTINQLVKNRRKDSAKKSKSPALQTMRNTIKKKIVKLPK